VRVPDWDLYVHQRTLLERHATGNLENVWNGRPISKIVLADAFSREHRAVLTGQQFQSADTEPYYVLFEDFTHVKFYRRSLYDSCLLDVATFDGFVHVDGWVPQRLVTATGPNPLPR
jgi:hypothetical protein